MDPMISFVVPVHNEVPIMEKQFPVMFQFLNSLGTPFEMVLCENGSTDNSLAYLRSLERAYSHPIRVEQLPVPDYGLALKRGIAEARGEFVFIFNADFWDRDFVREALKLLKEYPLVIGSKVMPGARDQRPFLRRCITHSFNAFLRAFYGFRGTDTHGLKAFRRTLLLPIASQCITNHFIFDSELVLRAQRMGLRTIEIPVHVKEIRQPSYRSLVTRIPKVTQYLIQLWFALRRTPR